MTKKYVLWDRYKESDSSYSDPVAIEGFLQTDFSLDGVTFIGIDNVSNPEDYKDLYTKYNIKDITVNEAITYCKDWYGYDNFELGDDLFTIIDLRPSLGDLMTEE